VATVHENVKDQGPDGTPNALLKDYYRVPLQRMMNRYYKRLAELDGHKDQPVAWITTMVPIEILHAAGVFPFYPENYSALCAARGVSGDLIRIASNKGVPRDLCGYATCNIGTVLSGQGAFGKGGVPRPDFLVASRLTCDIHLNWFNYVSRHYDVPLYIIDAPYRTGADYGEKDKAYFINQVKRFITFLEKQSGQLIGNDKLEKAIGLSDQASVYWTEISLSRKAIPSPLASRDVFSLMFPMVTLAGTPDAVTFYEDVSSEVKRIVDGRKDGTSHERYRLIWDLFPPWHDMKLWNYFDDVGAVFVIDFYADAFSGRLDNPDPFLAISDKYLYNPSLQRGIEDKKKKIEKLVRDFHLDAGVFMSNRSCRYFSLGQFGLAAFMRDQLKLPVLSFEGDHMDPERYVKEIVVNNIKIFLELLSERKNKNVLTKTSLPQEGPDNRYHRMD